MRSLSGTRQWLLDGMPKHDFAQGKHLELITPGARFESSTPALGTAPFKRAVGAQLRSKSSGRGKLAGENPTRIQRETLGEIPSILISGSAASVEPW